MNSAFYKIKIPLINKNYFEFKIGDKGKYKYRGTAYIVIERETKNIIFNTLLLDEDQIIYGADDGKYGKEYGISKKKCGIFEYRKSSFNHSIPEGKSKNTSAFKNKISELNKKILECKLTIKDVDGFISGSNPSGGLQKPEADPLRIYYGESEVDPLKKLFNRKQNNIQWKFFSLLSNISGNFRNSNFDFEITIDFLESLEEIPIEQIFEFGWKHVPYKEAGFEDLHIDFKDAFKSQNAELFDLVKDKIQTSTTSDIIFNEINYVDYIIKISERGNKRGLNRELRAIWRRIIDRDINSKKYKKDFVKGTSNFDRAHIIENKTSSNILLNPSIDLSDKKSYLNELFNSNNYILLTKDIHYAWDNNQIIIEENGDIKNNNLNDEEFKVLTREHNNIYSIYENTLNPERIRLIEERINWN